MADIEARREARRRKILENSENRLKKISGVEEKTSKGDLQDTKLGISHEKETESSPIINNTVENVICQDPLSSLQNNSSSTSLPQIKTIFQNQRTEENESLSNSQLEIRQVKTFRNLYIFVLPLSLSLILVLLELFEVDVKPMYLNKIFIPLLVHEILEYFSDSSVDSMPNFLTSLLLLTNLRSRFLTTYIRYLQYFVKITQDLMVYFFVFTMSHAFLTLMLL